MNSTWMACLAKGTDFEGKVAYPWILNNFVSWWITETRLIPPRSQYCGPSMTTKNSADEDKVYSLILPDFRLDHKTETGRSMWIDAKLKKTPFSLPNEEGKFFSLDPKSYEYYTNVMNDLGHPVWILLGCESSKMLYIWSLEKVQPTLHYFDNKFNKTKSLTPCFAIKDMKQVGTW